MISDCYRKGGAAFLQSKRFEAVRSGSILFQCAASSSSQTRNSLPGKNFLFWDAGEPIRIDPSRQLLIALPRLVILVYVVQPNWKDIHSESIKPISSHQENESKRVRWTPLKLWSNLKSGLVGFSLLFFFSSFRTASPAIDGSRRNFFLNLDFWRKRKEQKENYRLSLDYHQINYHKTEW